MLTTRPHLLTRRPSPTTAEFTVTTRPAHPTLAQRLLLDLALPLLRAAVIAAALLLAHATWALATAAYTTASPPAAAPPPPPPLLSAAALHLALARVHGSAAGRAAAGAAAALPWWAAAGACAAALAAAAHRPHATESLLVLRGLGVQTRAAGATYLGGGGTTRFIPTGQIRDVLLNEAFRGCEVRYYLLLVVEGDDDVVVVFPRLLPGREIVEAVWRGVRGCLYEPAGGGGREGKG